MEEGDDKNIREGNLGQNDAQFEVKDGILKKIETENPKDILSTEEQTKTETPRKRKHNENVENVESRNDGSESTNGNNHTSLDSSGGLSKNINDKVSQEKQKSKKRKTEEKIRKEMIEKEKQLMDENAKRLEELHRKKLEEIEKRKQRRIQLLQMQKEAAKRGVSKKPLYIKMEEMFQEKVIKPEIERRKNFLNELRSQYKALDAEEFKHFQGQYEEKMRELKMQRQEGRKHVHSDHAQKYHYNQKAMEILKLEEEMRREQENAQAKLRQELLERKKAYASLVKNKYIPKIDEKKREEIEERKKQERDKNLLRNSPLKNLGSLPPISKNSDSWENKNLDRLEGGEVDNTQTPRNHPALKKSISAPPTCKSDQDIRKKKRNKKKLKKLSQEIESRENQVEQPDPRKIGRSYLKQARELAKKTNSNQEEDLVTTQVIEEIKRKAMKLEKLTNSDCLDKQISSVEDLEVQREMSKNLVDAFRAKVELLEKMEKRNEH